MKLENIKQVCKKCKASCCKMGGPDFTKKEMEKVLKAGFKNCFSKIDKNRYELKSKNGRCIYLLKNYLCSIHKVKPLMCRCWPVYREKGKYIIIKCPLTPYLSKRQRLEMKKQTSKLPKRFVDDIQTNLPKKDFELVMKRFKRFKKEKLE
jgi:Fe-S-cluster containining protein